MATAVKDILRRVRTLLVDPSAVRWNDSELVMWLNDGHRALLVLKPSAHTTRTSFSCAAGTHQTLPSDGLQLLDVTRNLAGTKRAIRFLDRRVLDSERPDWHNESEATEIKYFCYEADEPNDFFVYPPAQAATSIEILYSSVPADLTSDGTLAVADVYVSALVDYVCARAYMKDADFAPSQTRAQMHLDAFVASLTGKRATERSSVPSPGTGEPVNVV